MFQHFYRKICWLFIALLAGLFFLLCTTPGLNFSFYLAKRIIPGTLSSHALEGYWLGDLSIEGFHYKNAEMDVQFDHLRFHWKPLALIHREFKIQALVIKHLKVASMNRDGICPLEVNVQMNAETIKATARALSHIQNKSLGELDVSGKYYPVLDINWTLTTPQLSSVLPDKVAGQLKARGKIQGTLNDTALSAQIEGSQLAYQAWHIKKILGNIKAQHVGNPLMQVNGSILLKPGDLVVGTGAKQYVVPFKKFTIEMQWLKYVFETKISWILDATKKFEGQLAIKPFSLEKFDAVYQKKQQISGQLLLALDNLDFLNYATSPIKKIQGKLVANFKLGGTLAKPLWNGHSVLKARGEIPELGLVLDQINVTVKSHSEKINLTGELVSNKQTLWLEGESEAPFTESFEAKVIGKNFLLMNTDEYQIHVSPDLEIKWLKSRGTKSDEDTDKVIIRGTLDVPSAQISPLEFSQALELPPDVVFVSDKKPSSPLQIESRVNVRLGNDVQIHTHGITGRLIGSVWVIDGGNEPTAGEGKIEIVDGEYKAYGQKLTIETGEANFGGGAIDNPELLVRATRVFTTKNTLSPLSNSPIPSATTGMATAISPTQSNSIRVGIEIIGYLNNPVIRLFSVPATLSQSDILSFLILGQPMSQASSADASLLLRAASALNIGDEESTQITRQLQQTFGVNLDVETSSQYDPSQNTTTNSTSLVIGKALSSQLLVNYSIGLMQGTNVLQVKYLLTPHWIFQTETDGSNQGVDLLYSFNRE